MQGWQRKRKVNGTKQRGKGNHLLSDKGRVSVVKEGRFM